MAARSPCARHSIRRSDPKSRVLLSQTRLRVAIHVPRYKILLGKLLMKFAPGMTLPAPFEANTLTRDPIMQKRHVNDDLRHGRISPPFYFGMLEGGALIAARAAEITLPTLLVLGGSDPVIDPAATRSVFDKLGAEDKTLRFYPEMLHEPLNEIGREKVLEDVSKWLRDRIKP